MNDDRRQTWALIFDVLDVLEKHGYHKADHQHTGRAIGLVGDLAHIYEGTREAPAGAYLVPMPEVRQAGPDQAGPPAAQRAEAVAATGMPTILAALDQASDYKRDRAAACADCPDQSCGTCQLRLDAAQAYDSLAIRLQHATDAVTQDRPSRQAAADPSGNRTPPQTPPEKEAGQ
jgi:hypothetical protein